ncbi:MAG: amino acid racemase [Pseudomonadota bacterium]
MSKLTPKQRVAGVLGGMGPEATVEFMARVLALTPAEVDQDHVHLIVDQNPNVPSRHEALFNDGQDPGPTLAAMARRLEAAGADFLVIPCNTVFAFADAVRTAVDIPLVSIVGVTLNACEAEPIGVMATEACIHAGVYQRVATARNIELILPSESELATFMQLLAAIKRGDKGDVVCRDMASLAGGLVRRGAKTVVMGCTEIPLVLSQDQVDVLLVSSTDALAAETVRIAHGKDIHK